MLELTNLKPNNIELTAREKAAIKGGGTAVFFGSRVGAYLRNQALERESALLPTYRRSPLPPPAKK